MKAAARSFVSAAFPTMSEAAAAAAIRAAAQPLDGGSHDYDELLRRVGDARVVLIGEASHGTHEFYRERARITKRLILEKGFSAVCLESDWPDAAKVSAVVTGRSHAGDDTVAALTHSNFVRFPQWMWANADMLEFCGWLRDHNEHVARLQRAATKRSTAAGGGAGGGKVAPALHQPAGEETYEGGDRGSGAPFSAAEQLKSKKARGNGGDGDGGGTGSSGTPPPLVGIYGLDLYSLYDSMAEVISFLRRTDPAAAAAIADNYACFDHFRQDSSAYGQATAYGLAPSCERDAVAALVAMQERAAAALRAAKEGGGGGRGQSAEDVFYAAVNAQVVVDAERYYREMFRGRVNTWNIRDKHMGETLASLLAFLSSPAGAEAAGLPRGAAQPPAKVVVWAHNSHVGDARATQMGDEGELNIGQLARQRFGSAAEAGAGIPGGGHAFLIGFSTYGGTVTAASHWDGVAERMRLRPGMEGSIEALFHSVGLPRFLLHLTSPESPAETAAVDAVKARRRLHRAVGVVYRPRTERASHYFASSLAAQYDAVIHIDETRAVEPLARVGAHRAAGDGGAAEEETFPFGV